MAMIRRYGEFPALFVPDEGEVVLASRSPAGPFLKAAVVKVRRSAEDYIRVDFEWLESSPVSAEGTGNRAGEKGNVYIHLDDPLPLIRRVPAHRD
jgi:hypothetical protein